MNPTRNAPVNTQTATKAFTQLTLYKKSSGIEVSFKEEKFSGAPDQCIDLTLRDLHICANNHSLTNDKHSQLVGNFFVSGALDFYLKDINPQMPYQMVVDKLRARHDTPHRKLSLQSEIDSLNFDEFMARHQIQDEKELLRRMVEYLNNITPQLVDCFYTESNKMRYLRNAVLGKKWLSTPLKNISTTQYSFDQLGMVLNERIQLEREIH